MNIKQARDARRSRKAGSISVTGLKFTARHQKRSDRCEPPP